MPKLSPETRTILVTLIWELIAETIQKIKNRKKKKDVQTTTTNTDNNPA